MSQYFDETLKNYYDKLTNSPVNSNSLIDHISGLNEKVNSLITYVGNTKWKESGKDVVINGILPKFNEKIKIFVSNINNNLIPAADKVRNELYPALSELSQKESELNNVTSLLASANDSNKASYTARINTLNQEMSTLSNKAKEAIESIKKLNSLTNLDGTVDTVIESPNNTVKEETKAQSVVATPVAAAASTSQEEEIYVPYAPLNQDVVFDDSRKKLFVDFEFAKDFLAIHRKLQSKNDQMGKYDPVPITDERLDPNQNSNITNWNTLGSDWVVVNTKFGVKDYADYAYNKGIRQDSNAGRYGDMCLAFSYVHASNLMSGSTADNAESAMAWAHAGEFKDYFSDNKQQVLSTIYNQIVEGKPVILQVNGNKEGTHRHFVTVVGFNKNVVSEETITEKDLLIYDSWDGKIESMDTSTSRFMTTGAQTGKTYSGYYLRLSK